MIVLDANVLLCAYDATAPQHEKARAWLEDVMSSGAPVGLPWQTIGAFLRIATNRKLPGARPDPRSGRTRRRSMAGAAERAAVSPRRRALGRAAPDNDRWTSAWAADHRCATCGTDDRVRRHATYYRPGLRPLSWIALEESAGVTASIGDHQFAGDRWTTGSGRQAQTRRHAQ